MTNTNQPDPEVYKLAAKMVLLGNEPDLAILSSVEKLHPEIAKPGDFDPVTFNWKWEHLHQYRKVFGDITEYSKPVFGKTEFSNLGIHTAEPIPDRILKARRIALSKTIELMGDLCKVNPAPEAV